MCMAEHTPGNRNYSVQQKTRFNRDNNVQQRRRTLLASCNDGDVPLHETGVRAAVIPAHHGAPWITISHRAHQPFRCTDCMTHIRQHSNDPTDQVRPASSAPIGHQHVSRCTNHCAAHKPHTEEEVQRSRWQSKDACTNTPQRVRASTSRCTVRQSRLDRQALLPGE